MYLNCQRNGQSLECCDAFVSEQRNGGYSSQRQCKVRIELRIDQTGQAVEGSWQTNAMKHHVDQALDQIAQQAAAGNMPNMEQIEALMSQGAPAQVDENTNISVSFPLNTACKLTDGQRASAAGGAPSELPIRFDWRMSPSIETDADNQYQIARFWQTPPFVDRNRSATHFSNAAELGHADAQYELGLMLEPGMLDDHRANPIQDVARATKLYTLASSQGHAGAVEALESRQRKAGEFEKQLRAAEEGDAQDQYVLALLYSRGKGVQRDADATLEWLERAAEQDHAEALYMAGDLRSIAPWNDAALSQTYFERSGDLGFGFGYVRLGDRYYAAGNLPEAGKWYRKALNDARPTVVSRAQFGLSMIRTVEAEEVRQQVLRNRDEQCQRLYGMSCSAHSAQFQRQQSDLALEGIM
jgi:TPR repeat protein